MAVVSFEKSSNYQITFFPLFTRTKRSNFHFQQENQLSLAHPSKQKRKKLGYYLDHPSNHPLPPHRLDGIRGAPRPQWHYSKHHYLSALFPKISFFLRWVAVFQTTRVILKPSMIQSTWCWHTIGKNGRRVEMVPSLDTNPGQRILRWRRNWQ